MKTFQLLFCAPLLAGLVSAGEGKPGDAQWAACKGDVERFCKDVEPGGGRIMECLKSHEAELSEGCKPKGGENKQAMMEGKKQSGMGKHPVMQACSADVEKFCAGVEPGEGRIVACLKAHESELSEGCKAKAKTGENKQAMMEAKKQSGMGKHPGMQACSADKEKFCAGVEPGEGRIVECLKTHKEELSEGCRSSMPQKGGK